MDCLQVATKSVELDKFTRWLIAPCPKVVWPKLPIKLFRNSRLLADSELVEHA